MFASDGMLRCGADVRFTYQHILSCVVCVGVCSEKRFLFFVRGGLHLHTYIGKMVVTLYKNGFVISIFFLFLCARATNFNGHALEQNLLFARNKKLIIKVSKGSNDKCTRELLIFYKKFSRKNAVTRNFMQIFIRLQRDRICILTFTIRHCKMWNIYVRHKYIVD